MKFKKKKIFTPSFEILKSVYRHTLQINQNMDRLTQQRFCNTS